MRDAPKFDAADQAQAKQNWDAYDQDAEKAAQAISRIHQLKPSNKRRHEPHLLDNVRKAA